MKKSNLITAVATAVALSTAQAAPMEKCSVTDKEGRGLIKARKADCASANSSCAGGNKAGDPLAWILVPKGQCEKINAGDFSGVSQKIKDKIEGAS